MPNTVYDRILLEDVMEIPQTTQMNINNYRQNKSEGKEADITLSRNKSAPPSINTTRSEIKSYLQSLIPRPSK